MMDWRNVKNIPEDWYDAVRVDRMIRNSRDNYKLFLHRSLIPLEDVDLRTPQEKGQMELWANWDDECSGVCGV
jgi:hypothetical protein